MKNFISEYGKYIISFLVAMLFLGVVYMALETTNITIKDKKTSDSGNNNLLVTTPKPKIVVKNTLLKKGIVFNPLNYVITTDSKNNNINNNIEVFGNVNTSKKGMYDIRYTVRDSIGLFSEKKVTFVVD